MPLYEYECEACGKRFELIRRFSDAPPEACTLCGGGPVNRLPSSPAIQFKGSGFYITDYARKGEKGGKGEGGREKGEGEKADKTSTEKTQDARSDAAASEKGADQGAETGAKTAVKTDTAAKSDAPTKSDAPAKPSGQSSDASGGTKG